MHNSRVKAVIDWMASYGWMVESETEKSIVFSKNGTRLDVAIDPETSWYSSSIHLSAKVFCSKEDMDIETAKVGMSGLFPGRNMGYVMPKIHLVKTLCCFEHIDQFTADQGLTGQIPGQTKPPQPSTIGIKHDSGKLQWDLLPWTAMKQVVQVFEQGAEKYGRDNWKQGINYTRCWNAAIRHLTAWKEGEDTDAETGLNHLAHAAVNCLFLLYYQIKGGYDGFDNRR
jgi:hypothetical protein